MSPRQAFARGGLVAGACVACCAPPIIAVLGVTAGLAAAVGIFLGLAAAVAVLLFGGTWIAAGRARRRAPGADDGDPAGETVAVAAPVRRHHP